MGVPVCLREVPTYARLKMQSFSRQITGTKFAARFQRQQACPAISEISYSGREQIKTMKNTYILLQIIKLLQRLS